MNPVPLTVEVRTTHGKEFAQRLRREKKIPAVLYGHKTEPVSLMLSPDELRKALDNPYKRNTVFELEVNGEKHNCLLRELQTHPVSERPLHVDFYAVSNEQTLEFNVPLRLTGRPVGVQKGGQLLTPRRALKVACTITQIPQVLELEIGTLDINQHFTVTDLPLTEGVKVLERPALVLASVVSAVEEEEAPAEGAAAAAPAAAAAAPAKDAAAAKPKK